DWDVRNNDLCFMMYTGGTTGWPKGVLYDNWNRVGSMRWGMASSGFESAWDGLSYSLLNDKSFLRGTADNFLGQTGPLGTILVPIVKMFGDILSKSKGLRDILYPVLTDDVTKRLIYQYLWPHLTGQPLTYGLLTGGRLSMIVPASVMHGLGYEALFTYECAMGATGIFQEPAQPFDAKIFWETVERERANSVAIVGDAFAIPMIEELERADREGRPYDTSSLWVIQTSGVRWSAHLKRRFLDLIPQFLVLDMYGTTESGIGFGSPATSIDKEIPEHTTYMRKGHGYSASSLLLDLDTGEQAKPGCERAQFVYGGFMGLGYWKAPSKAKKDWTVMDGKRWFLVGDEGYVDDKGGFHLQGRGGGYVINTGGEKVYSEEVEEAMRKYPGVKDAAVVGIPDEKWGEAVTAIVELEEGRKATEEEMREHCRGKIAGYKIPKNFVFHKVLRTDVGKIMRPELMEVVEKGLKK
ncbi:MAG: hypothetical protein EF807_08490, partial [Candidatus Methanolliviera hydrocarbonicum]